MGKRDWCTHPTASLKCWEEKDNTLCTLPCKDAIWRELDSQPGHSDRCCVDG